MSRWHEQGIALIGVTVAVGILLMNGCGGKSSVLLEEPLQRVAKVETNAQALRTWAAYRVKADVLVHIDAGDDMAFFPGNLQQSMKNAAIHLKRNNLGVMDQVAPYVEKGGTINLGFQAGFFKRVIWVLPAKESVSSSPLESFKREMINTGKYNEAALANLAVRGKYIEGTIASIPLTVTTLEDLVLEGETAILDIDVSYFLYLKQVKNDYQVGTRSLVEFLREIKNKKINTYLVTVTLSSLGGVTPLDIRYYGNAIKDFVTHPDYLTGSLPVKYDMMIAAEDDLLSSRYEKAESLYTELARYNASDPGIMFSLALSRGLINDGENCREAMLKAYLQDPGYLRGFFQLARMLGANRKMEAGRMLLETPELVNLIAEEEREFQMGVFYLNAAEYHEAIKYFEFVALKRPNDFSLRTTLYRVYSEVGNDDKRGMVLEKLLKIDENRVIRDIPWVYRELGMLKEERGSLERAKELYEKYLELVPGDPDAARMRRVISR
ncbi:MAG: hypothetical protein JXB45_08690 [Candidatus Krumholzibacteriota bacterium]|nr:hypothetical protein [Candidatus Krumholzibacteriota bacterium]